MADQKTWVSVKLPFQVAVEGEASQEKVAAAVRQWFDDIKQQGIVVAIVADQKFRYVEVKLS